MRRPVDFGRNALFRLEFMAGFVVVITVFYENLHIEFCEGVDIPN